MAFDEVRFPSDIALGVQGGPSFSTDVIELYSGAEKRNVNWSQARCSFNCAHAVKTQTQLDTLVAFFRARQGKANGFRFRDWSDYKAIAQNIGTGDASNKIFQLRKAYTSGAVTVYRTITKPVATGSQVSTTLKVYVNSVQKTEGVDFTVDYTTGIVTFVTAPGAALPVAADFEFDVPVRFDTDQLSGQIDDYTEFSWQSIPLVEVRS